MRYHYDKPDHYTSMYGQTYICDHPVYSHCTLYKIGEKGLAVIQQRYIPETKSTYWTEIDPWLVDVKKEFGDLLWFIAEYCTAQGWSLDDIMRMNIDKLKARYPEGFEEDKSFHRAEGDI